MNKKVILFLLLFAIGLSCNKENAFAAETATGTIGIILKDYDKKTLETQEAENNGIYVFVREIDTEKTYRFPLSRVNQFEGRFDIPYGNYRVIDNPDGDYNVTCNTVFNVSDESPAPTINCSFEENAQAVPSNASTSIPKEAEKKKEESNKEKSNKEEAKSGFNFQLFITIIVFGGLAALYIYRIKFAGDKDD